LALTGLGVSCQSSRVNFAFLQPRFLLAGALCIAASATAADSPARGGRFQPAICDGVYPRHLQGVCTDERGASFWSWTDAMVKTDLQGRILKQVPAADHHGDLCYHDGKVYVAVNLGRFNQPPGSADSWVYVYDAGTLAELARHPVPEAVHGAGGIAHHDGKFIVVGGLPEGIEENYIYEYDAKFVFQKRHVLPTGYTRLGIQTAAYADDSWWFGCYGTPPVLLRTDGSFRLTGRWEFDAALGIVEIEKGRFLIGQNTGSRETGYVGRVVLARVNEEKGMVITGVPSTNRIEVDADFPGGNIIVEKIEDDIVEVRTDLRDTEGWWFYWCFRVGGAAGRTLTFNFTEGAPVGVRGPAVSHDEGATWAWLGKQQSTKSFAFAFPPNADSVRFSFGIPYTETHLNRFLARVGDHRGLKQETLCQSRKGRAVERLHVGKLDGDPRFRVLVTCRAHACEMMTSYAAEGLIEAVLADDADGNWFRQNVELLLIPFVDKDGVEDGDQGKNRRPRDHNRDYDASSIYPETRAIQEFVPRWSAGKLRMTLDLHCPSIRGRHNEVIYLVGSMRPEIWAEQERFGRILEDVRVGPLIYLVSNNLPFGQGWNTDKNYAAGTSGSRWAAGLPGVQLATTIELPYANASGGEVNASTARAFGHDLARAIRVYLDGQDSSK
jgi:hypothetical protein